MKTFKTFADAAKAFQAKESKLVLTPEGNGGYDFEKKPRTPAQNMATRKAGLASAMKRKGGMA